MNQDSFVILNLTVDGKLNRIILEPLAALHKLRKKIKWRQPKNYIFRCFFYFSLLISVLPYIFKKANYILFSWSPNDPFKKKTVGKQLIKTIIYSLKQLEGIWKLNFKKPKTLLKFYKTYLINFKED